MSITIFLNHVTGQNFTEITWTFLGAIYKVEIDQRWIVLKEVVQK